MCLCVLGEPRVRTGAAVMIDAELRRKVGWLIAVRAVISTILLGSATLVQIRAPGSSRSIRSSS